MDYYVKYEKHTAEGIEPKQVINKRFDDENVFRYDQRTGTVHLVPIEDERVDPDYLKYVALINEVTMIETKKLSSGQRMLLAGFVPLVVEPSFGNGKILDYAMDALNKTNLPFKEITPQSFTNYDGGFRKTARDIWIHRMDGLEFLNAPNVYQVTTTALWRKLGL